MWNLLTAPLRSVWTCNEHPGSLWQSLMERILSPRQHSCRERPPGDSGEQLVLTLGCYGWETTSQKLSPLFLHGPNSGVKNWISTGCSYSASLFPQRAYLWGDSNPNSWAIQFGGGHRDIIKPWWHGLKSSNCKNKKMLKNLRGGRKNNFLGDLKNSAKEKAFKFSPQRTGVCRMETSG